MINYNTSKKKDMTIFVIIIDVNILYIYNINK